LGRGGRRRATTAGDREPRGQGARKEVRPGTHGRDHARSGPRGRDWRDGRSDSGARTREDREMAGAALPGARPSRSTRGTSLHRSLLAAAALVLVGCDPPAGGAAGSASASAAPPPPAPTTTATPLPAPADLDVAPIQKALKCATDAKSGPCGVLAKM